VSGGLLYEIRWQATEGSVTGLHFWFRPHAGAVGEQLGSATNQNPFSEYVCLPFE